MKKVRLSLVIPYYNDAGCPVPFIKKLQSELKNINYELILVNDCSQDTTPQELDSLKNKNIHIIHNKKNLDYGGAIIAGLKKAKGDILGFSCGDGEVSEENIVKVYENMGDFDVIKAIRKNRQDGINRKIIPLTFNILAKLRFNLKIKDVNGYPVFFKKEVYQKLHNLRTDWIFNTDLFRKIVSNKYEVHGVIVDHKKRSEGKSKMVPLRILKMVWRWVKYK